MKEKLCGVKSEDPTIAKNILYDISILQSGAPDEESFNVIFGLLRMKWLDEKIYYTDSCRKRVDDFFSYMEEVWMCDDLKNWFEAANPMMCSINNLLEGANNLMNRISTDRKRFSMSHLFDIMNGLLVQWSSNMKEEYDRMQLVPRSVKIKAEELLKKVEPFILFREAERVDRPTVKARGNVLNGKLIQVGTCPRLSYKVTNVAKYETHCTNIIKRRRYLTYSDFDQFRIDLSEMVIMEVIKLDDGVGMEEIFCNCSSVFDGSGIKGQICVHVCARYFNVLYKVL